MEATIFEGFVATIELALITVELIILIIILAHMKNMRVEDKLLKENIAELRELHVELHESMSLLKEDIKDLNENNTKLQEFIRT